MRLSVLHDDPGYNPRALARKPIVMFNGKEITHVITADEEMGMVRYYPQPTRLDPEDPSKAFERTIYGKVKIDFLTPPIEQMVAPDSFAFGGKITFEPKRRPIIAERPPESFVPMSQIECVKVDSLPVTRHGEPVRPGDLEAGKTYLVRRVKDGFEIEEA